MVNRICDSINLEHDTIQPYSQKLCKFFIEGIYFEETKTLERLEIYNFLKIKNI